MEGARRIDEWSRIERKIPHLGVVPALAASEIGAEGQLDLLPPEWEVLAVINGARDVRQLASLLGRSDFDVAKTLFGLESAGILALGDGPPARRGDGDDLTPLLESAERALDAGDLEGARGTVEAGLSNHPHDAGLYFLQGRIHLAAGRVAESAESLRRALRVDPLLTEAHRLLAESLVRQGQLAEAVEWWQRWLAVAEQSGEDEEMVAWVHRAIDAAQTLNAVLKDATVLTDSHG